MLAGTHFSRPTRMNPTTRILMPKPPLPQKPAQPSAPDSAQALQNLLAALKPFERFAAHVSTFHPSWQDQDCDQFPILTYRQWRELMHAIEQAK